MHSASRPGAEPPGPRPRFTSANFFPMRRDILGFLRGLALRYGDVVGFRVGRQRYCLINDPDAIGAVLARDHRAFSKGRGLQIAKRLLGEGLLTSEGELHRRQRRLAQPAFHRERISAYAGIMISSARRLDDRWADGAVVDMSADMMELTLGIVGKALFNTDVEAETREIGDAITDAIGAMNYAMLPFADKLEWLAVPIRKRFARARARLDNTIYGMIREHRLNGRSCGDLLSMLLDARDDAVDGCGMTDEQVRDEAMTIFLAGHETTANALTWTWMLLAQHPAVETKLHAELDSVLAGRLPTDADVPRLVYTRMVVAESMRRYPPAWIVARRVLNDYRIGDYLLPTGTVVMMSQYVTHHDPRWYPEPFQFEPERWAPGAQELRPRYAYYPFGSGPRVCIGEGFAWMETILLIAALAQRWSPRLAPGQRIAAEPLITLRPKYGMKMTLKRRPERVGISD